MPSATAVALNDRRRSRRCARSTAPLRVVQEPEVDRDLAEELERAPLSGSGNSSTAPSIADGARAARPR
jgi:hypothetical protein